MTKTEEKSRRFPEQDPKHFGTMALGTFRFNPANGMLSALDGGAVTLRAQSSRVLGFLARHAGEVVNREVLIDAVWGDTFVTDDSLIQCISEIRKAIGDTDRSIVQTFPKKGYRLAPSGSGEPADDRTSGAQDTTLQPRIAVLAFDDLSNGADRGFLSDAIAEAVAADLSHFGEFSVVARNSSFRYRGTATDVRTIGKELGALYVLEGSQQKDGDRLRVAAQLIDALTAKRIWSETFVRVPDDLFTAQSEIAEMIAASVGFQAAFKAPRSGGLGKFSALRYHLRARELLMYRTEEAEALNLKAIEVEPDSPYGYFGLTFVNLRHAEIGLPGATFEQLLERARSYAEKALERAPQNAECHYAMGVLHSRAGEMLQARRRLERSLELNPAASHAAMQLALVLSYQGECDEAISRMDQIVRTHATHQEWFFEAFAKALFRSGDYRRAETVLAKKARIYVADNLLPAAIYMRLGQTARARELVARCLLEYPDRSISRERKTEGPRHVDPAILEDWLDALRQAGLPEG